MRTPSAGKPKAKNRGEGQGAWPWTGGSLGSENERDTRPRKKGTHPVLLLSGFGMFTESLVAAVRGKGIVSWAVVAFNAYVTLHNWSRALPIISELFKGPAQAPQAPAEALPMVAIVVAISSLILALGIGITMTVVMIRKAAKKEFSYGMRRAA